MKRTAVVREIRSETPTRAAPAPRPAAPPPLPALATALVREIGEAGVVVEIAGRLAPATLDPSVSAVVIEGAHARRERVIVEQDAGGAVVVVGALRTQPTPGIDEAEAYSIRAGRISLEAKEELSLSAQAAALALRAVGEVETYADRIVSRAESVHKVIGRILRLN